MIRVCLLLICSFFVKLQCTADMLPQNWTNRIHPKALRERRSQLTVWIDKDGAFYDDQFLHPDSEEYHSGRLPASKLWPNKGKGIPYSIDNKLDGYDIANIKASLQLVETKTAECITFKQKTTETDFITFARGSRCESSVGKQGGLQYINLTATCMEYGTLQHIILHALGVFHEHQRPDRNNYVQIYEKHAINGSIPLHFRVLPDMQSYDTPYDIESIMHYGALDFARSKNVPVMVPKDGKWVKMGQRMALSTGDVMRLYNTYNCSVTDNVKDILEPLPSFASDFVSMGECNLAAVAQCLESGWTVRNCTGRQWLYLECRKDAHEVILMDMSQRLAAYPQRATNLQVYDGPHLGRHVFNPIRRQITRMGVIFCLDHETISKRVSTLFLPNLLQLQISHCYNLTIKKNDFGGNDDLTDSVTGFKRLRILIFHRVTIKELGKGTFTDLPALRILSMEYGLHFLSAFVPVLRRYLKQLHCGCDFAWFRSWRRNNSALLNKAEMHEVYSFDGIWPGSPQYTRKELYYPIDCSVRPFPWTHNLVNFSQMEYSVNEPNCS